MNVRFANGFLFLALTCFFFVGLDCPTLFDIDLAKSVEALAPSVHPYFRALRQRGDRAVRILQIGAKSFALALVLRSLGFDDLSVFDPNWLEHLDEVRDKSIALPDCLREFMLNGLYKYSAWSCHGSGQDLHFNENWPRCFSGLKFDYIVVGGFDCRLFVDPLFGPVDIDERSLYLYNNDKFQSYVLNACSLLAEGGRIIVELLAGDIDELRPTRTSLRVYESSFCCPEGSTGLFVARLSEALAERGFSISRSRIFFEGQGEFMLPDRSGAYFLMDRQPIPYNRAIRFQRSALGEVCLAEPPTMEARPGRSQETRFLREPCWALQAPVLLIIQSNSFAGEIGCPARAEGMPPAHGYRLGALSLVVSAEGSSPPCEHGQLSSRFALERRSFARFPGISWPVGNSSGEHCTAIQDVDSEDLGEPVREIELSAGAVDGFGGSKLGVSLHMEPSLCAKGEGGVTGVSAGDESIIKPPIRHSEVCQCCSCAIS